MSQGAGMTAIGTPPLDSCPGWCVVAHDPEGGEEDAVHVGAPLAISDEVLARACMSVDPSSGVCDGPYVVVGWTELSLEEAETLGASLIALARAARPVPHAAG
jgi:hypothetical protein